MHVSIFQVKMCLIVLSGMTQRLISYVCQCACVRMCECLCACLHPLGLQNTGFTRIVCLLIVMARNA